MERWARCFALPWCFLPDSARADGAAGCLAPGAGIDSCVPDVPVAANPPDFFVAAGAYILRPEVAI